MFRFASVGSFELVFQKMDERFEGRKGWAERSRS